MFAAALRRQRGARADDRPPARLRAGPRLAAAPSLRSTATRPWPSWPAAIWPVTVRPTRRDLARWAGVAAARRARRARRDRRRACRRRRDGLVDLRGRRGRPALPPPRLLGAYRAGAARLALARRPAGRASSRGWSAAASSAASRSSTARRRRCGGSPGGRSQIEPLVELAAADAHALAADGQAVLDFLGL